MIPASPTLALWRVLALAFGLLVGGTAGAERADRERPTQVEADSLRHDDVRQTTVFTGHVVLTRGTLANRAARPGMRRGPAGYQHGPPFGNPAPFPPLPLRPGNGPVRAGQPAARGGSGPSRLQRGEREGEG